ncbi:alanyl-tRNA synthetase [Basidiobolus meristosporus CBS 931.73]|uniref:Alanine--tRNA ligase n=1 Tax=Basidiobolus meristosporus CBS 931.73 TaxID=1314790 RepID=A0A1Y1Z692_9FUNG|nr:alanyl-tRNA synthetase [Basidiobolus meristosporus CBS 931.73]|eukprot:ORY05644.1 alanyl-tRNA synthetase [Basidiobolus meristosporus CBS 931.73]
MRRPFLTGILSVNLPKRDKLLSLGEARYRRYFKNLSSIEIRERFMDYFAKQEHKKLPSSSLIPHNDKTLLFTNAGMVPFKENFLKPDTAPFKKVVTIQKCMRAGGKHNDLDNVGHTPRHHTFFEMMGCFSFGGYTKETVIRLAWNFLTEVLELPEKRLRVSVLNTDEQSYNFWKNEMGLSSEKIIRCDEKDNFWSMGDGEGPCGPCTEIFWDTQRDTDDEDRWLEIWNLVFMEFYRKSDGTLEKLPTPCIDTGMGMERLASVLQCKESNFEIDSFVTISNGIKELMKKHRLSDDVALSAINKNIIADHLRASAFLISDGVVPSNIGRGYVLRRIIRRAVRAGRQLGLREPFLAELYPYLIDSLGPEAYPEIREREKTVKLVMEQEEKIFLNTLEKGLSLLENVFHNPEYTQQMKIPGEIAFQLYDTHGFPVDLTELIAREKGWSARFTEWKAQNIVPTFTGYSLHGSQDCKVLGVSLSDKDLVIALDDCPFYGLGGGQVADKGYIQSSDGQKWEVIDVFQPYEKSLALRIRPEGYEAQNIADLDPSILDGLKVGESVKAVVDDSHRKGAAVHHTATHLLNAALKNVLKKEVMQAGSLVESSRLRFDFTHGKPLSPNQVELIEEWVNQAALSSTKVVTKELPLQEAIASGAVASFAEKYGETVRVIDIPELSKELCGGTHVHNTESIYPFKIVSEGSVAAGTRRIEAIAGNACVGWLRDQYGVFNRIAKGFKSTPATFEAQLAKLVEQNKSLQRQVNFYSEKQVSAPDLTEPSVKMLQDIPIKIHEIDPEFDNQFIAKRANFLKSSEPNAIHILTSNNNIIVALDKAQYPKIHAGKVLKNILQKLGGKGGGQAEMAQGKLPDLSNGAVDLESSLQEDILQ